MDTEKATGAGSEERLPPSSVEAIREVVEDQYRRAREIQERFRVIPTELERLTDMPEEKFKDYVARVRSHEMAQRRKLAARRRRDAEVLGLSAEESDQAEERREDLRKELGVLEAPFSVGFPPPPAAWQPDEAALAEGQRRYERYLHRMIMWHFERPDIHPPLRSHDGNAMIRDYAWDSVCERRVAEIREELGELGEDMEGGWALV